MGAVPLGSGRAPSRLKHGPLTQARAPPRVHVRSAKPIAYTLGEGYKGRVSSRSVGRRCGASRSHETTGHRTAPTALSAK